MTGYVIKEDGGSSENSSETGVPPIKRRFFYYLFSLALGGFISVRGWDNVYEQRKLIGATQVVTGTLIVLMGVTLFLLTGYRGSWGWWL